MINAQHTECHENEVEAEAIDKIGAVCAAALRPCRQDSSEIEVMRALLQIMAEVDARLVVHGEHTARYALALGHAVGLRGTELDHLRRAALLHDIGKLTLPQAFLHKDGPLTDDEYALVQSHPAIGASLIETIPFLEVAAVWIAHHHERWDGYGYPYGVRGTFIPLGSRILAVADTYDALTSSGTNTFPARGALAIRLLKVLAGSQLDPTLVDVFVSLPILSFSADGNHWRSPAFTAFSPSGLPAPAQIGEAP